MQQAVAESGAHEAEAIEHLLERIRAMAAPGSWKLVEELVQRLTGLYGRGLERMLLHARASGTDEGAFAAAAEADELLANLLLLHGLHPLPVRQRITNALERVRPQLGLHDGGVELAGIGADGVVSLRLLGRCDGCGSSQATVEQAIRTAIEAVAPEVTGIEIVGAAVALPVLA